MINKKTEEQIHFKTALSTPHTEVICVDNIYDAIFQLSHNMFTVIIMDTSLAEKYGDEFLKKIKSISHQPILVLSLKTDDSCQKIIKDNFCMNHGNDDMILTQSISRAWQLMYSNVNHTTPEDYRYTLAFGSDLVIEPERRQVYLKGKKLNLTRKEYDMLFCLASNAGKILSREQLYAQIWDEASSYNVDDLVKAHIKTLRKKLSDADVQYIKNVWGVGYRFDYETEEDGE